LKFLGQNNKKNQNKNPKINGRDPPINKKLLYNKQKNNEKKIFMSTRSFGLCGSTFSPWNLELCDTRASQSKLGLTPYPSEPLDGPRFQLDRVNLYEAITNQSASSLGPDQSISIFKSLVDLSGLAPNFQQTTRFTVMAPVNSAFLRLSEESAKALDECKADAQRGKKVALKDWVIAHVINGGNRNLANPVGTSAALCKAKIATSVLSTTLYSEIPVDKRTDPDPIADYGFTLVPLERKCPMTNLHKNPLRDINKASDNQEVNFVKENIVCTNGILHTIDGMVVAPNSVSFKDNLLNINVDFANPPPVDDVGI